MIVLVADIAQLVLAMIAGNFLFRAFVFGVMKRFGVFDPRWDQHWPRFPWRPLFRFYVRYREWVEENISTGGSHTEGFASFLLQMSNLYRRGTLLIGRVRIPFVGGWYQPIGQKITRHCLIVAATRSSKSVYLATLIALQPRMATAYIIDPKGFFSRVILPAMKAAGRAVHVIDPLGITGWKTASINLLQQIPELCRRVGQDVSTIIFDLLAEGDFPKIETRNPFFMDTARMLWAALLAHVLSTMKGGSMVDARRLLTVGYIEHADGDPTLAMQLVWQAMAENPCWDGYISKVGHQMLAMAEKTQNDVLSTARSRTKYLDHQQIRAISEGNSCFITDLKRNDSDLVLALALPTTELRTTFQPLVSQITAFTLKSFELIEGNLKERCRLYLEEMPSWAGSIPGLIEAWPLLAGYGAEVIAVLQDKSQAEKQLPGQFNSMFGNSDVTLFMSVGDPATERFVSEDILGNRTRVERQYGRWRFWNRGSKTKREQPVMSRGQVRRFLEFERGNMIAHRAGKRAYRVKVPKYYQELPVWLYEPDKEFREPWPRRFSRAILHRLRARDRREDEGLRVPNDRQLAKGFAGELLTQIETNNRR